MILKKECANTNLKDHTERRESHAPPHDPIMPSIAMIFSTEIRRERIKSGDEWDSDLSMLSIKLMDESITVLRFADAYARAHPDRDMISEHRNKAWDDQVMKHRQFSEGMLCLFVPSCDRRGARASRRALRVAVVGPAMNCDPAAKTAAGQQS
ncbi:hypothetical protein EJB05_15309, partial [Eragrostis curvula]